MIEPRNRGKTGSGRLRAAMREIARECEEDPAIVRTRPTDAGEARGQVGAAKNLVLAWKPAP